MIKKRTTIYMPDQLIKMLKLRSVQSNQSMSGYISQIVYQELMEEKEDLKDIRKILGEPTVPFEKMLKDLKIQNDISD